MREIKFRGKRLGDGEWITGGYFNTVEVDKIPVHCIVTYRDGDSALTEWKVDPATVGQFTGLKDKNGVDIYEGQTIYLAGYGEYVVEFPFIELYEAGAEGDIGAIIKGESK